MSHRFLQIDDSSGDTNPLFGEALAFYTVSGMLGDQTEIMVVYRPIVNVHQVLRQWQGIWGAQIVTARVSSIQAIVGIWTGVRTKQIHIIRKHPGLNLLSNIERGNETEEPNREGTEHLDDREID